MIEHASLGELVAAAEMERAGSGEFTVLSMTSSAGLVPQVSVFKKTIASRDISSYKVVRPNQLVVGIHIDEGALGFSGNNQIGIVSPAYTIWKLKNPDSVHIPYLDRFVRSPQAIAYFISNYRETAERRGKLTHDQFLALRVPFPPLPEQRRIAAILDQADALRAKRREALAQLDSLTQSIFIEMFSDALTATTRTTMGALVKEFRYGTSEKSSPNGYPALRIPNVASGSLDLTELKTVPVEPAEFERLQLLPGDLLFVRTNGNPDNVGRCAVFEPSLVEKTGYDKNKFIYASYLIRARLKKSILKPLVLQHYLSLGEGRRALRARCKTSAGQYNINTESLAAIPLPVFPSPLQERFSERIEVIESLKANQRASVAELDALFASLQHRAFRGEL